MKASNKNNGFKTPEDYFEGLTDKLLSSVSDEESVLPKNDGFKIPEGYFDSLQENILQKLESNKTKVIQLNPYRKYYFAAAAAAVLLFLGINLNTESSPTFEELADSDIESYFEGNDMELSSYELAEVISFDELDINDILDNQLIDDHIIDYLDDNIDDLEELNLETDE